MEIEIYGFHRGLRGVFWACHRGVDQPKVGSATVVVEFLEFVASSHCPVAHAGVSLAAPPCPRGVSGTSSPLQSAVWAFKETFYALSFWTGATVNICLEGGEGGRTLCVGCLFCVDPFPFPASAAHGGTVRALSSGFGRSRRSLLQVWGQTEDLSSGFRKEIDLG